MSPKIIPEKQVRPGYKVTEVGIIPMDWEVKRLGELLDFKNGLNKEKEAFGYGTPIVNYMDVYGKRGLTASDIKGKVSLSNDELRNYEARKGDVFFTRTSETVQEIGYSSILLEDIENATFSGFVLRGRPKNNELFGPYEKYCFSTQSVRKDIISSSTYTTRALTNGRSLSKVRISLPSKPEQFAIAQVLSDTDALIVSLEALIAKKKAIKHGTMQELLTGKRRLPGFSGEWEDTLFSKACEIKRGQMITSSIKKAGKIPVIAGGKMPAYYHNESNRNGKTITISASGANAGYIGFYNTPIFASDCSTISESNSYSIKFIYYFLLLMQNRIYLMQTGGAQPHIHPKDLNPIKLSLPCSNEQSAIAQVLSDIDSEISDLENKRDKYKHIKQGMMSELLTGNIRLLGMI
ncbi:restriction endonuclease subunit S [Candidatus Gracilibacteria bacterium]|nr:restriction endonuclease subunit S [Candidatus Gracilibacteria bacterium]